MAARQSCWADEKLSDYINDLAKNARSAPNQVGELMYPSEINLHPEGIPRPILESGPNSRHVRRTGHTPRRDATIRRARIESTCPRSEAETLADVARGTRPGG